jgi:hypothetical protein
MMKVPLLDIKAQHATIRSEIREAMPEVEGLECEIAACFSVFTALNPNVTRALLEGISVWMRFKRQFCE